MRAFSAVKYAEPIQLPDSVLLRTLDGKVELRVFEPLKYITVNNCTYIYSPGNVEEKDRVTTVKSY